MWDIVEAKIRSDAVYFPSFYILLAIARLIGAVGILTNSQILIVGAMVVGPEYNAIMGIALGIDKRNKPPILRGALALLAGFSAAVIVTLIFGLAIRWSGHTPRAYSLGVRPVSNLIENLNLFSLIVAVLAGIVRVVSLIEARSAALIGVWNRVIHSCSRCQPSGRCSVMCPRPDRALRAATLIRSRRSVAPRAFADARLARAPGGAQQVAGDGSAGQPRGVGGQRVNIWQVRQRPVGDVGGPKPGRRGENSSHMRDAGRLGGGHYRGKCGSWDWVEMFILDAASEQLRRGGLDGGCI